MAQIDVGVVGAGPSGLILARCLAGTSASFEIFERNADVGGIWDIDAPGSPMYESAHLISSRDLSGFSRFPMPDHYPDYPSHRQFLAYIRAYADVYGLRSHISFNTGVESAVAVPDGSWELRLNTGEVRRCRYLVCASGVTWAPHIARWPGKFNGEVRHSVTYRSPTEFAGKRVLVVGAGNSGVDIACDASLSAERTFLSMRRGQHFLPKFIMGKPSDAAGRDGPRAPRWLGEWMFRWYVRMVVGDLGRYGLPEPDHRPLEASPVMNTQILHHLGHGECVPKPDVERFEGDDVVFADGSREQIDLVIAATGYERLIPYVDDELLAADGSSRGLYLGVFPRDCPNLAALGFLQFTSFAQSLVDNVAELIVADATAAPGSPTALAFQDLKANHHPDLTGGRRFVETGGHTDIFDIRTYLRTLDKVRKKVGLPKANV